MKKPSLAGLNASWELSAREVLFPLLLPGESLRMAFSGATGWFEGVSFVDLVMWLLGLLGGGYSSEIDRTTYIGITDEDLVFAIAKNPKKPPSLQRAPLGNVSIVKFKESRTPFLIDVLVINTGTKRLTLSTGSDLRPVIRELAEILTRTRQEADMTGSARQLRSTLAPQAAPLPLHIRLIRPLSSAPRNVAATLRVDGPAHASIRASQYSFSMFFVALAADFVFIFGPIALTFIFPTAPWERFRDLLLFLFLLPVLLTTLLSIGAALTAGGLAIYSIFKRGEKPLTVLTALAAAAALLICYAVGAFGAVALGGD